MKRARCIPVLTLVLFAVNMRLEAIPPGFSEQMVGSGWSEVAGITFASDGRMFVWERGGRVWNVDNGTKSAQPVIDISDEVGGWRDYGLLGLALHPDFYNNGYIYLFYVVDHHHLIHFGTPSYDPGADEYFMATIGRITRYTLDPGDDFRSTLPNSRLVLVGETIDTGFPIMHQSHGTGSILFGEDGTLLATCGDGASYSAQDTGGDVGGTYTSQALAEGIIGPREDVGAYRCQMVDSLSGKVIRIDPLTGNGLPSNPFFDPAAPRAPRSRVWALGLRNPCRMTIIPESGSHQVEDGDPGVLLIGDVGWNTWEDLHRCDGPGLNFGWPAFEGMEQNTGYYNSDTANLDAPNPLFGIGGCTQQYFYFRDLITQDTLDSDPSFPNPCDSSQEVPASIPRFVHSRPIADWRHGSGPSRVPIYNGNDADVSNIGSAGSPVAGPQFGGNCSIGGVWYSGDDFPATYKDTYFHADYGAQWIRNFVFDAGRNLTEVRDFATGRPVIEIATHPIDGSLYYVSWSSQVWKISYTPSGNQPPTAVATLDEAYGPTPHAVQFTGSGSSDPEGLPLTYEWDFGDGSPVSSAENPQHTFSAPPGVPTRFDVTLMVTDSGALTSVTGLIVSVNNTPPDVTITSPLDGTLYPLTEDTVYDLTASTVDAEHGPGELACAWQTFLHHNNHFHEEPVDPNCSTSAVISPIGCTGETYFYRIVCTVTDDAGLSGSDTVFLFPNCGNVPPLAIDDSATVAQGHSVDVDVLLNDTDSDGAIDASTVEVFNPPSHGTTSVDPVTGVITYTHDASMTTSDGFTYTVMDDAGGISNAATVAITAFNNPPTVTLTSPLDGYRFTGGESVQLRATADDPEDGSALNYDWEIHLIHNDHLHLDLFTWNGPSPPDYVLNGAPDVQAGDRISYLVDVTVTDVAGLSAADSAHLLPAVEPPNQLPSASFTASPAVGFRPLSVSFDGSGSSDPDGDYLLYEWDFGDGSSDAGPLVNHTYTQNGSFNASLTVIDAIGKSSTSSLVIDVMSPGLQGDYYDNIDLTNLVLTRIDPTVDFDWGSGSPDPLIGADTFSVRWTGRLEPLYSELYTFYALTDDGFRLWVDGQLVVDSWVDQSPTERTGTISLTAGVQYDIRVEYYENGGGAVASLSWSSVSQAKEIVPSSQLFPPIPNAAPVADDDAVTTDEDSPIAITLTASDADGDPLSFSIFTLPANGTLAGAPPTLTYVPDPDFNGADSFDFEASDGQASDTGTVMITVNPINDPPVASNQGVQTDEDVPVAVALGASDPDGDALTYSIVTGPANGTLSGAAPGLTYTPDPGFFGADSFTFRASDGAANSNLATVSITVNEVSNTDVISIVRAEYHSKRNQLNVRATSSKQPDAILTIRLTVGGVELTYPLPFQSKKSRYETTIENLQQPDPLTLTIESSAGGSVTGSIHSK